MTDPKNEEHADLIATPHCISISIKIQFLSLSLPTVILTTCGMIELASDTACSLFCVPLQGKNIFSLVHIESLSHLFTAFADTLEKGWSKPQLKFIMLDVPLQNVLFIRLGRFIQMFILQN